MRTARRRPACAFAQSDQRHCYLRTPSMNPRESRHTKNRKKKEKQKKKKKQKKNEICSWSTLLHSHTRVVIVSKTALSSPFICVTRLYFQRKPASSRLNGAYRFNETPFILKTRTEIKGLEPLYIYQYRLFLY